MLIVRNISFSYSESPVLKQIDLRVKEGEHLAVIGESGSGKSTLLKLIYGEYDLDEGHIYWKDTEILGPKFNLITGYPFMKQVSQEFDLMPVTTVAENIGKFLSRFQVKERQQRIDELIDVVELKPFSKTKVKFLSGGQKQRVALARALAKEPEVLLLDEPFSHIDNFKKQSLRRRLFNYLKLHKITCIVATHDKNDVMGFADQMLVLHQKKILAQGAVPLLYQNPKFPLIASFFGEYSVIEGRIYYAHQLQITESSKFKASVQQSYYNGHDWLIEAIFDTHKVYINHQVELEPNLLIYFEPKH